MTEVTRILSAIEHGDADAARRLLPLVYDELRRLAAAKLADEKPGQTLQALADGNIKKARKHFTIVTKTGKILWWCHNCSKAILAYMDRDPNRPNWIPRRTKSESSPGSSS